MPKKRIINEAVLKSKVKEKYPDLCFRCCRVQESCEKGENVKCSTNGHGNNVWLCRYKEI